MNATAVARAPRDGAGSRVGVTPCARAAPRIRLLRGEDAPIAARLAHEAFQHNAFYERVMGLDARAFGGYWCEFFRLALGDPRCRVYGISARDELQGALVVALHGFPGTARGARFLWRLLARVGPRRLLHYLRFVRGYERVMRRPASEMQREARCYWLFVSPSAPVRGLGSRLFRAAVAALHGEGFDLATGFVDAGNGPLLQLYRRLGLAIGPTFRFLGVDAVRVEIPTARVTEPAP